MDFTKMGNKIAIERIKNNKTQECLAEEVGITPAFLSNIETGKRKPSLSTLILLANKLNLSLDYLLINDNIDEIINKDIYMKQLYKQIEKLDNTKKQKLLEIIDYIAKKI